MEQNLRRLVILSQISIVNLKLTICIFLLKYAHIIHDNNYIIYMHVFLIIFISK